MKKLVSLLLLAAMLLTMAVMPAAAEGTPVELTFHYPVGVGGDLALLIENLAAEFTKENPDIILHPVFCGNSTETTTKTIAAIQGGNPPEFAILGNSELYSLLSLEAIIPLDDLINGDPDGKEYIDDFWPAFLMNSYYEGKIYSIPWQRSTIIMYYNKDAFRAAGLDPETPPANWEQLVEYAQKLTIRDEAGNVKQWGVQVSTNDPFTFSPFAMQNSADGENLMTPDGKTALFNTQGNIDALQFLVDLGQKYKVMPEGVIVWADSTSNFMAGTAAMLYMSSGSLTNVLNNTDFEVGTAFLPAGKRYGSATGGANFYIMDGISDEKLAATWKFIRWMTEPERAAQWSIDTGYVATRKSCFDLDLLKNYFAAVPQAETAGNQLVYAGSELMLYDNTRCWDILKNAIDAAMTLAKTPEQALADAQEEVDEVLSEFQ